MTSSDQDVPNDAPLAIVAGHADFAVGLISAVEQITGRGALLLPMSGRGLGAADIEQAMRRAAEHPTVRAIFTDLPAGSCTMAARRLLRERTDLVLVTGANVPAVLDFVLGAGPHDAEAARHAAEKGRGAVAVHALPAPERPAPEGRAPEGRGAA